MNRSAWPARLPTWLLAVLLCVAAGGCVDDRAGPLVPVHFARSAHEGSTQYFQLPVAFVQARAARLIDPSAFLIRLAYHSKQPQAWDAPVRFDTVDVIVEVLPVNQAPTTVADEAKPGQLSDSPAGLVCCLAANDVSEFRAVQMADAMGNRIRFVARGALIEGQHQRGNVKVRYFFSPKITTNYRAIDEFAMNLVQGLLAPGR